MNRHKKNNDGPTERATKSSSIYSGFFCKCAGEQPIIVIVSLALRSTSRNEIEWHRTSKIINAYQVITQSLLLIFVIIATFSPHFRYYVQIQKPSSATQHNPPVKTRTLIHFGYTLSFMKCFQIFPSFGNSIQFFRNRLHLLEPDWKQLDTVSEG